MGEVPPAVRTGADTGNAGPTAPTPADEPRGRDQAPPGPGRHGCVLAPVPLVLRAVAAGSPGRRARVLAAVTPDAVVIQDAWRHLRLPLTDLAVDRRRGRELILTPGPNAPAGAISLTFPTAADGDRWYHHLRQSEPQPSAGPVPADRPDAGGVALVRRAPAVPRAVLGRVEVTGPDRWTADRAAQLRAGLLGADAVVDVRRAKCPEFGWGGRRVTGLAVRVDDPDARDRLRTRWYTEEVSALVGRMLVLLVVQAAGLLFAATREAAGLGPGPPTGETRAEAVKTVAAGLGLVHAWPLAVLAVLRVTRWPQLLRPAGLAVLAVTTGRGLAAWAAHLLAVRAAGASPGAGRLWVLLDPFDWAVVVAGAVLCGRAWRLAREADQVLPAGLRPAAVPRAAVARAAVGLTGAYAVALAGVAGYSQYESTAYVLQPGVDPRREQEALLALDEGAARAGAGDLAAAERSYQQAVRAWEGLTAGGTGPSVYRANLAIALAGLGWVREQQGRGDEAEGNYARAVAAGEAVTGDPGLDPQFRRTVAAARDGLAGLHRAKAAKALEDKGRTAFRRYEEAQVKAAKGEAGAEPLFREAIALWEEVLPGATNPAYRTDAAGWIAAAYLNLAAVQQDRGDRAAAEAALRRSEEYGERAVALAPDRPLPRHHLEEARRLLDGLRDQAVQAEVDRLIAAGQFADARDRLLGSVREEEDRARTTGDRAGAARGVARRRDRLAWFLAHCPDDRVRDTKAAVAQARRAADDQPDVAAYWYTLASAQYRNGDYRDSLASLDRVTARAGEPNAAGLFLSAMALYRLDRREDARAAFRKGVAWIAERRRRAEGDVLLRVQLELNRDVLEALRREAEAVIEGKDPGQRLTRARLVAPPTPARLAPAGLTCRSATSAGPWS